MLISHIYTSYFFIFHIIYILTYDICVFFLSFKYYTYFSYWILTNYMIYYYIFICIHLLWYFFIYMHIINARSHTSHCFWLPPVQRLCFPGAIFEFFDGLPDMHVLIPKWVMEDLAIDERLWCDKGYPVELLMHQMVFFKLTVHGKPSTNAHGSKILIEGNVSHPKTSDWRIPFLRKLLKS